MFKWLFILTICIYGHASAHGKFANFSEELFDQAAFVVVGKVLNIDITYNDEDPELDVRRFRYQLRIEAVEKGDLNRGETIQLDAWAGNSLKEGNNTSPWSAGYSPLPLVGERGRFFLSTEEANTYEIVFPNGVELDPAADKNDPRRIGDELPEVPKEIAEETIRPTSKDPFGWDVILILLGIPFVVGAIRQKSRSRWGLLVVGALMFLGAVMITSWS